MQTDGLYGPLRASPALLVTLAEPAAQNDVTKRTGLIWAQILDVLLATVSLGLNWFTSLSLGFLPSERKYEGCRSDEWI